MLSQEPLGPPTERDDGIVNQEVLKQSEEAWGSLIEDLVAIITCGEELLEDGPIGVKANEVAPASIEHGLRFPLHVASINSRVPSGVAARRLPEKSV
jgi:hypothetical protein